MTSIAWYSLKLSELFSGRVLGLGQLPSAEVQAAIETTVGEPRSFSRSMTNSIPSGAA